MTTTSKARWLAHSPAKRYTELLFLAYSPFWMVWALGVVVPFKLYEHAGKTGYMAIGLGASLPCIILPWLLDHKADRSKPWYQKYWVKANIWVAIFSFIGNYFWTHYFYTILGAEYTFPSWRLNEVPITLYFMTHAYFCFYHALSNVVLRRTLHAVQSYHTIVQWLLLALVIFILAYITALMETVTIAHFPYYSFKDRSRMYTWGSVFYAIYFWVSFPVFFIMDEKPRKVWTVWEAARDSLASGMAVTMLLDFWRIAFTESKSQNLPWLS